MYAIDINQPPGVYDYEMPINKEMRHFSVIIPRGIDVLKAKYFFFFKGQSNNNRVDTLIRKFSFYLTMNNCIGIFPKQRKIGKHYSWPVSGNEYFADYIFIVEIIKYLPLPAPIMFCGVSNGGCFALKLNESGMYPSAIYSTVAASSWVGLVTRPANIIAIHGKLDRSVPYDGGIRHGLHFLSAEYSITTFTNEIVSPIVGYIPGMWTYEYKDNQHTAKLYAVENAGHNVLSKYKEIDLIEAIFLFFRNQTED